MACSQRETRFQLIARWPGLHQHGFGRTHYFVHGDLRDTVRAGVQARVVQLSSPRSGWIMRAELHQGANRAGLLGCSGSPFPGCREITMVGQFIAAARWRLRCRFP